MNTAGLGLILASHGVWNVLAVAFSVAFIAVAALWSLGEHRRERRERSE